MNRLRRILGIVFLGAILFIVARMVYRQWGEIVAYDWHPDWGWLFLSLGLLTLAYGMGGSGWVLILRKLGERIPLKTGLSIYFASLLTRYLPGGFWFILGRVYLCTRRGLSKGGSGMSILLEQSYALAAALTVAVLSLTVWKGVEGDWTRFIPSLVFLPAVFLLLHPSLFLKILNPILRRMNRPVYAFHLSYRDMLALGGYYLLFWGVHGLAFYLFLRAFYPLPWEEMGSVMGINALVFMVGFVAFFAPAGLGVREGAYILLLGSVIPGGVAVGVAILFRLFSTLMEVGIIGLSLFDGEMRTVFGSLYRNPPDPKEGVGG